MTDHFCEFDHYRRYIRGFFFFSEEFTPQGKIAFRSADVEVVAELTDKEAITKIRLRSGETVYVSGEYSKVLDLIENAKEVGDYVASKRLFLTEADAEASPNNKPLTD